MEATSNNDTIGDEEIFKKRLVELGLLSEITSPLEDEESLPNRQPTPIVGNPISDLVIRERR